MSDENTGKCMIAAALIQSGVVDLKQVVDWKTVSHLDPTLSKLREATNKIHYALQVVLAK